MIDERRRVPVSDWVATIVAARGEGFTYFDWLTAVDQCDAREDAGFDVVVHLLDVRAVGALQGLLVSTRVLRGGAIPSLTGVFAGAAWHERETHEMFGLAVDGFDDGTSTSTSSRSTTTAPASASGRCCCPTALTAPR